MRNIRPEIYKMVDIYVIFKGATIESSFFVAVYFKPLLSVMYKLFMWDDGSIQLEYIEFINF